MAGNTEQLESVSPVTSKALITTSSNTDNVVSGLKGLVIKDDVPARSGAGAPKTKEWINTTTTDSYERTIVQLLNATDRQDFAAGQNAGNQLRSGDDASSFDSVFTLYTTCMIVVIALVALLAFLKSKGNRPREITLTSLS